MHLYAMPLLENVAALVTMVRHASMEILQSVQIFCVIGVVSMDMMIQYMDVLALGGSTAHV